MSYARDGRVVARQTTRTQLLTTTSATEPDILAGADFRKHMGTVSTTPERKLMVAVLEDAFLTWLRVPALVGREWEWFASAADSWPFDFERICQALEFNAAAIRRRLREIAQHSADRVAVAAAESGLLAKQPRRHIVRVRERINPCRPPRRRSGGRPREPRLVTRGFGGSGL